MYWLLYPLFHVRRSSKDDGILTVNVGWIKLAETFPNLHSLWVFLEETNLYVV